MDIVYSCDENFAGYAAVSIASLFENNRQEERITVYILANGISPGSRKRLISIGERYSERYSKEAGVKRGAKVRDEEDEGAAREDIKGKRPGGKAPGAPDGSAGKPEAAKKPAFRSKRITGGSGGPQAGRGNGSRCVRITDLGDFAGELKETLGSLPDAGRFTLTTLVRIFAVRYLPKEVERFLYLDSDTMVRAPLKYLFTVDMQGCIAGMVPEPTIYPEVRAKLGITGNEPYYNAGVLLSDRYAWERSGITEACLDFLKGTGKGPELMDQDVLNRVLKGRVLTLPPEYDFFSNYYYRSYQSLVRLSEWYSASVSGEQYDAASEDPVIVHFAGLERPWYRGNFNPYRKEYLKYLALTPWAGAKGIRGHELAMLMYHLMNLVTAVCPAARDFISIRYYNKKIKR